MARSTDDLTSCKRDAKLENFLKHKLGEGVFERMRAYEACIAQSRKIKRNFKFVVLTNERIYVTDNPPKVIREEESVHLGDVTSVRLVNDFPDFLKGEDRENTLHICVKYKAILPVAQSKMSLLNLRKNRKNGTESGGTKSNPSSGSSSPSLRLTTPVGEIEKVEDSEGLYKGHGLRNGKVDGLRMNRSFDEAALRDLHRMMESDEDDQQEDARLSISLPTSELKKLSIEAKSSNSGSSSDLRERSLSSGSSINKVQAAEICRPLPLRPASNPAQSLGSIDIPNTISTNFAQTLALSDQRARTSSLQTQHRSPDPTMTKRKSEPFVFPLFNRTSGKMDDAAKNSPHKDKNGNVEKQTFTKSKSLDTNFSRRSSSTSSDKDQGDQVRNEEIIEELHIHLLSQSSPFLMHLKSSWNNYIVRSTLLKDPKVAARMGTDDRGVKKRLPSRESLERQFQQLKLEILNSTDSMPDLFQLVQELCNAAEKYFVLKKLFWKNEDLFEFMIAQLGHYLPKSVLRLQNDRGRHHRADELELAILLIESLGLMFRETEMLPGRLSTVKANNGKAVLDLIVLLTCLPEVPQRWRPPKSKAQSLLLETDTDGWETYADAEVFNLIRELTDASTAVLFELILIAHQANWGSSEGRFLNICWLIRVLESLPTTTYKFVERLISRAMRLLMPSGNQTLLPDQAVLLFQQFFVLQTVIQYSSLIAAHVRNNYTEEFRYYVRSPHIVHKLPTDYPITKITLQLIGEVLSHVLQEHTVLQPAK